MELYNYIKNFIVSLEFLGDALEELAKYAPLYLVVAISFIMFWLLYKHSSKVNRKIYDKSIEEISKAHKDTLESLKEAYARIYNDEINSKDKKTK